MNTVLTLHIFSCWFMTGVIWLVQILVYPNFKFIGKEEFEKFHQFHMNRITWIVAPVMALELLTAVLLLVEAQTSLLWWNFSGILLVWVMTATLNVPFHNKLLFEVDQSKSKLILSNWPRTIIWTTRSSLWIWVILEKMNGVT